MKELLGLEVKLLSNGDITIIDSPENHARDCFGPYYGTEREITGIITEAEPVVEISKEWLDKTLSGEWPLNTPIQYEIKIKIGVSMNKPNRHDIYTGHWSLLPSHINYLLNKNKGAGLSC